MNYWNTARNAVTLPHKLHIPFLPMSAISFRLIELLQWAIPFFISEDLQDWIFTSCCSFCIIIKPENALQLNHADVERYSFADLFGVFFICYLFPIKSRLQSLNGIATLIVPNVFHCKVKWFNLNCPENSSAERE